MIVNCQFFDIFEKLKNDQYEVISAMATAKNLNGRCRPQKSSRELSQKICLRSSTVQEKPLAIAAVSDNEFNFGRDYHITCGFIQFEVNLSSFSTVFYSW